MTHITHHGLRVRRCLLQALLGVPLSTGLSGVSRVARAGDGHVALPRLDTAPAVTLPATRQLDMAFAGRLRRVFVAVPEGPPPAEGHAVLWVLDGNALFPLLAALLRQRAARPDDVREPLPVIVGLGLPGDATYDLAARAQDYTLPDGGGQGDRLLDALASQLRPWLADQMPLHRSRHSLFGHSFGGLLTLYALFTRPGLFEHHVAASPSIWWGDRAVLRHRDAWLRRPFEQQPQADQRLLVTAGSLEEGVAHPNAERVRRQQARRQIGAARELVDSLAGARGLQADFRLLEGEDHGSVVLSSARLALASASA